MACAHQRDPSKKKGGSPDPDFLLDATRQNSSLNRPGTMSMTRSAMVLGNAP